MIKKLFPPYRLPIRAASALIYNNKNQILLLKRSKSSRLYRHYWQLPEGKINPFERPDKALQRELEEEIALKKASIKLAGEHETVLRWMGIPYLKIQRHVYYVAAPKKVNISFEHEDFAWVEKKDLKQYQLLPGVANLIETFTDQID